VSELDRLLRDRMIEVTKRLSEIHEDAGEYTLLPPEMHQWDKLSREHELIVDLLECRRR